MVKKTLRNFLIGASTLATIFSAGNAYAQQIVSTAPEDLLRVGEGRTTGRKVSKPPKKDLGTRLSLGYGSDGSGELGLGVGYGGLVLSYGEKEDVNVGQINEGYSNNWTFDSSRDLKDRNKLGVFLEAYIPIKQFALMIGAGATNHNYTLNVFEQISNQRGNPLATTEYSEVVSLRVPGLRLVGEWRLSEVLGLYAGVQANKIPSLDEIKKLPGMENADEKTVKKMFEEGGYIVGVTWHLGGKK